MIYNLPVTRAVFDSSEPTLVTGVYMDSVSLGSAIKLPVAIDQIGNNYEGAVKAVLEEKDSEGKNVFIKTVTGQLTKVNPNFLYNVLSKVSNEVFQKYTAARIESGNDVAASRIYPDSTEPLVGWIATVTPMFSYLANYGYGHTNTFWFVPDNVYHSTGNGSTGIPRIAYTQTSGRMVRLIMDGYAASQYNSVTKALFTDDRVNSTIFRQGVVISSSKASTYANQGLLRTEYGNSIFENAGRCTYVTDPTRSLMYGLHTSDSSTAWTDDNIHLKGGITVVDQPINEQRDTTVPVFYYTTPTPDKPEQTDPKSVSINKPFTPNPPENTTVSKVIIK